MFTHFVSVYNTVMKVYFIAGSAGTCYLMAVKFKVSDVSSFASINLSIGALIMTLPYESQRRHLETLM